MVKLEEQVEQLYVRALLAIARADREIDAAEGARLDDIIKKRFPSVSVADLMFEPTLRTDELAQGLGAPVDGGPFRNSKASPHELGKMFVADALAIMAAHEGISSAEEAALLRFAPIFGMPVHEAKQALARRDQR